MDRIIEVKVNGSYITMDNQTAGVQGEANVTGLRIEFDAGWDGFVKTVTWWNAKGENPTQILLTVDTLEDIEASGRIYLAPIPPEALAIMGKCQLGIDGYTNGRRQRSAYATMVVKGTGTGEDIVIEEPTPSLVEQLQYSVDNLLDDVRAEADRAQTQAGLAKQYTEEAKIEVIAAGEEQIARAKERADLSFEYAERAKEAAVESEDSSILSHNYADAAQGFKMDTEALKSTATGAASAAQNAQKAAEVAQKAAENARDEARSIVGVEFVLKTGDAMSGDLDIEKDVPTLNLKAKDSAAKSEVLKNANSENDFGTDLVDRAADGSYTKLTLDTTTEAGATITQHNEGKPDRISQLYHEGHKPTAAELEVFACDPSGSGRPYSDANNLPDGVWKLGGSAANLPVPTACIVYHKDYDQNFAAQIAYVYDETTWTRHKTGNAWRDWQQVHTNESDFTKAQILSPETKTLFGLGESATPDDIFSILLTWKATRLKFEIGSYVGTGTYGSSNPNTLTFPFAPKLVWFLARKPINTYSDRSNFILYDFSNKYDGSSLVLMDLIPTKYPNAVTYDQNLMPPSFSTDSSSTGASYTYSKKSNDGMTLTWYCKNGDTQQYNDENHEYYYAIIG